MLQANNSTMPKRSASDALQAVVPAPKVEGSLKSRSGRVVRPKVSGGSVDPPAGTQRRRRGGVGARARVANQLAASSQLACLAMAC